MSSRANFPDTRVVATFARAHERGTFRGRTDRAKNAKLAYVMCRYIDEATRRVVLGISVLSNKLLKQNCLNEKA